MPFILLNIFIISLIYSLLSLFCNASLQHPFQYQISIARNLFLILSEVSQISPPYVTTRSTVVLYILIFVLAHVWLSQKIECNCLVTCSPCPIRLFIFATLVLSFVTVTPRYLYESNQSTIPSSNNTSLHVFPTTIHSVLFVSVSYTHLDVYKRQHICSQ